jgi:hypothetical protein
LWTLINLPSNLSNQEVKRIARELILADIITDRGYTVRPCFKGFLIKSDRLSTKKAIKTWLRYQGYIS